MFPIYNEDIDTGIINVINTIHLTLHNIMTGERGSGRRINTR